MHSSLYELQLSSPNMKPNYFFELKEHDFGFNKVFHKHPDAKGVGLRNISVSTVDTKFKIIF
jgi:hypothetical protein